MYYYDLCVTLTTFMMYNFTLINQYFVKDKHWLSVALTYRGNTGRIANNSTNLGY
jgi:hypothetical protein